MISFRPHVLAFALAGLLGATACSDSTAPGAPFDATTVAADVAVLENLLSLDELSSFEAMSGFFNVGSGSPAAAVSSARAFLADRGPAHVVARRTAVAASTVISADRGPSLDGIPASVRGKTFVFDESQWQYVPSSRTGAPANGVRFILYAIDPLSGAPVVSSEVGYADLIDLGSTSTSAAMRLKVVGGNTTYLDYGFSASATQTSATMGVDGFVTDGSTRLDFDIDAAFAMSAQSATATVNFDFDVPSEEIAIDGAVQINLDDSNGSGSATMTVVSGGTTIRYVMSGSDDAISATVHINGGLFARISGSPDDPTVTGAGGAALTAEEAAVLVDLFEIVDDALSLLGDLTTPFDDSSGGF